VIFLTNFMIKPSKAYYVFVTQHALEIEGYWSLNIFKADIDIDAFA
jgi:hypothetical protein